MIELRDSRTFDLRDPACAYVFGFMQADGHHYAGKGRKGTITAEIKAADVDLLRAMQAVLPWSTSVTFRTRPTNFAQSYEAATLTLSSLDARTRFLELGLPTGRKSAIIAPPTVAFSHRDYLRGSGTLTARSDSRALGCHISASSPLARN